MDKIAVDAMGGDFAPLEIVKGAVLAVRDFHVPVVLVGDKEQIVKVLKDNHADQEPLIEICHASQVIGMGEHPGMAFRKKKDASVSVGAKLVKNGECGALVAPGSTGAAVTAGLLGMGRVDGIERPAILTPIPNRKDGYTFLIDSGASAQPKPETLLQNALMGYVYAKKVWHIENPRIGLLNIGEESTKGSPVVTRLDYAEYGGAPLMGIKGGLIICHGASQARAIRNAIHMAKDFCEARVVDVIAEAVVQIEKEAGRLKED